jgi:hypothetical protein
MMKKVRRVPPPPYIPHRPHPPSPTPLTWPMTGHPEKKKLSASAKPVSGIRGLALPPVRYDHSFPLLVASFSLCHLEDLKAWRARAVSLPLGTRAAGRARSFWGEARRCRAYTECSARLRGMSFGCGKVDSSGRNELGSLHVLIIRSRLLQTDP